MFRKACLLAAALLAAFCLYAAPTRVRGVVTDAQTGEPLPYVSVIFVGTRIGTMTDPDGAFSIENLRDVTTLSFQMLGYQTVNVEVPAGVSTTELNIAMQSDAYGLQGVVVTPKRGREGRYRRRDNPAVQLVRNVIAHKERNHVHNFAQFKSEDYDKLVLSLDDFRVDFDSSHFWRHFPFFEKYVDTLDKGQTPVLPVSLLEQDEQTYYQRASGKTRTFVRRRRLLGIAEFLDKGAVGANIRAIFADSDICDDNINILMNRFVSPLSSPLATTFYKYYISDTLSVDGTECIDLTFVPANNRSYGFTGHLYVVNDSTYALKRYTLGIPARINLNYVSELSVEEDFFQTPEGWWAPRAKNTYARFYVFRWMRQLYAKRSVTHHDYDFSPAATMPDTLALLPDAVVYNPDWWRPDEYWHAIRTEPLSAKERVLDSLKTEIRQEPRLSDVIDAIETVSTEFMPTARDRSKSRWDYGPLSSLFHYDPVEGFRLRVGGMTTANLSDRNFLSAYAAYGFADKRPKGGLTYVHSFVPRDYHPYEPLRHNLILSASYDLEAPGQSFSLMDRDHFMMSSIEVQPLQYVRRFQLGWEREWISRLSLDSRLRLDRVEPTGSLSYQRIAADGSLEPVRLFDDLSWTTRLRYAPGEPMFSSRLGKEAPVLLTRDAPVLTLTHTVGRFDGRFWYNRTELSAQKRIWLSAFGHIDASLQGGIVWNSVPLPKLFTPNANLSFILQDDAFNLMRPMEFVSDRYASFSATYFLKGWILNRIPLINTLGLREVASFRALAGSLSDRNNPALGGEGLYTFPAHTRTLDRTPYMEYSVGLENIFNLLRVDYIRRISYTEGLDPAEKNGFKVSLRVSF
ncbi:MAG: carboxypeptidase-like regulatory domain-containing protein [Bacteroidales bacterium]|nr:carboxypeptidase-like regulatory domain-containing protein [Bacteroidales bacterium]